MTPGGAVRRVGITGARGFIGRALARHLTDSGHAVVRIGRAPDGSRGEVDLVWDPRQDVIDIERLSGVDAIVNLAGETIGQRWTGDIKRRIVESRVITTDCIARACARLDPRPRVLVNMSAVGFYGNRGDEELDEQSDPGSGFLAGVVREWENATRPAQEAGIRVVFARCGLVLHPAGSILARLLPLFRLGAGGVIGDGAQWMSWIGRTDALRALSWLAVEAAMDGPVNVTAPNPVTNAEFTRTLARLLRRPAIANVPAFAIRLMFGEMGEETVLAGQRVVPSRLLKHGFRFEYPELQAALAHELNAT